MIRHRLAVYSLLLAACSPLVPEARAATPPPELRAFVEAKLAKARVPGLGACVIRPSHEAVCYGFGLANRERGLRVTPDTPFLLASVSKTVTAAAVMRLAERGVIGLDDDVRPSLDFPLRHPRYPDARITYRMLLTHTAGVGEPHKTDELYTYGRDPAMSLSGVLKAALAPGGELYDASDSWLASAPGEAYRYSNLGIALLGYLVERKSGGDFAELSRREILLPLGMRHSGWHLADFADHSLLAMPYALENGKLAPTGHYTFPDYPDGGLRASCADVAKLLGGYMRGTILRPATIETMLQPAIPSIEEGQGLVWYHELYDGDDWVGHTGAESGVATEMGWRLRDGLGLVMLMNGEVQDEDAIEAIRQRLLADAQR